MQEQLNLFSDQAMANTDAAILGFAKGLDSVVDSWKTEIGEIVAGKTDLTPREMQRVGNIMALQLDLQKALNKAGYNELLAKLLKSYDANRDLAAGMLDAAGYQVKRLAPLNAAALSSLKKLDYAYLSDLGNQAVSEISRQVTMNAIAGQPRRRMIEAADKVLTGKFKPHAATYADTALTAYDRRLHLDLWKEAGVRRLLYRGPGDIKNRPFCAARVGQVFTFGEIEKMRNGVGPEPPLYYGGGWNCRHVWVMAAPTAEESASLASAAQQQTLAREQAEKSKVLAAVAEEWGAQTIATNAAAELLKAQQDAAMKAQLAEWAEQTAASAKLVQPKLDAMAAAKEAKRIATAAKQAAKDAALAKKKLYDKTWSQAKKLETEGKWGDVSGSIKGALAEPVADLDAVLTKIANQEAVHAQQLNKFASANLEKPGWLAKQEASLAKLKQRTQTAIAEKAAAEVAAKAAAEKAAQEAALAELAAEKLGAKKAYDKAWTQSKAIKKKGGTLDERLQPFVDAGVQPPKKLSAALAKAKTASPTPAPAPAAPGPSSASVPPKPAKPALKSKAAKAPQLNLLDDFDPGEFPEDLAAEFGVDDWVTELFASAPSAPPVPKQAAAATAKPKPGTDWAAVDAAWDAKVNALKLPPAVDLDELRKQPLDPTWKGAENWKQRAYGGILINDEGKILLREPSNHFDGYHWTWAKGKLDGASDHPADAALRELGEETGYTGQIIGTLKGTYKSGSGSTTNFYFMRATGHDPALMDQETNAVKWVSFEEAKKLIGQTTNTAGRQRDLDVLAAVESHVSGWKQSQFKKAPNQPKLGGAHEKAVYLDEAGNSWLFKPAGPGKTIIPYGEEAAYKIARHVDPNVVEARTITIDGRFGSIQRLRTDLAPQKDFTAGSGGNSPIALDKFTADELRHIQQQHVVDWLVSNHDGHPGQFLRTIGGDVLGIDKAQAYKHLGEDKLSIDYHPNAKFGEQEPLYNTLGRAFKQGKLKLDPMSALPAIRRAEAISDADLRASLRAYAETRYPGKTADQEKFLKNAIARKNAIRADFERYYSDLIGEPYSFEKPDMPPVGATAPAVKAGKLLDERNATRAAIAAQRGGQGMALRWDTDSIEDHNVLMWEEKIGTGVRTAFQFKIRPEVQEQILAAVGPVAKTVSKPLSPDSPDLDLIPVLKLPNGSAGWVHPRTGVEYPVPSKSAFKQALSGTSPAQWVDGYGKPLAPETADKIQATLDVYKKHVAEYRKELAAAQKKTDKQAAPAPDKFTASAGPVRIDRKKLLPGFRVVVEAEDQDLYSVAKVQAPALQQITVKWDDGTELRWIPHVPTASRYDSKAYAWQGTARLHRPGSATPESAGKALAKLNDLGIASRPVTPAEEEAVYLTKQAYSAKLHKTAEWRKAAAGGLGDMRAFWSKKLGTPLHQLPGYQPAGHSAKAWDADAEGGQQLFERFDVSREELNKRMPGYGLYHTISGDMAKFFDTALPLNSWMVPTLDKLRAGIPLAGWSPEADQHSGGAAYFFTRILPQESHKGPALWFKKEALLRLDAISYPGDYYGETIGAKVEANRGAGIEDWLKYAKNSGNETIFKGGLSIIHDLDYVQTGSAADRKAIINTFKTNGYALLPDGRKIEDVIR